MIHKPVTSSSIAAYTSTSSYTTPVTAHHTFTSTTPTIDLPLNIATPTATPTPAPTESATTHSTAAPATTHDGTVDTPQATSIPTPQAPSWAYDSTLRRNPAWLGIIDGIPSFRSLCTARTQAEFDACYGGWGLSLLTEYVEVVGGLYWGQHSIPGSLDAGTWIMYLRQGEQIRVDGTIYTVTATGDVPYFGIGRNDEAWAKLKTIPGEAHIQTCWPDGTLLMRSVGLVPSETQ